MLNCKATKTLPNLARYIRNTRYRFSLFALVLAVPLAAVSQVTMTGQRQPWDPSTKIFPDNFRFYPGEIVHLHIEGAIDFNALYYEERECSWFGLSCHWVPREQHRSISIDQLPLEFSYKQRGYEISDVPGQSANLDPTATLISNAEVVHHLLTPGGSSSNSLTTPYELAVSIRGYSNANEQLIKNKCPVPATNRCSQGAYVVSGRVDVKERLQLVHDYLTGTAQRPVGEILGPNLIDRFLRPGFSALLVDDDPGRVPRAVALDVFQQASRHYPDEKSTDRLQILEFASTLDPTNQNILNAIVGTRIAQGDIIGAGQAIEKNLPKQKQEYEANSTPATLSTYAQGITLAARVDGKKSGQLSESILRSAVGALRRAANLYSVGMTKFGPSQQFRDGYVAAALEAARLQSILRTRGDMELAVTELRQARALVPDTVDGSPFAESASLKQVALFQSDDGTSDATTTPIPWQAVLDAPIGTVSILGVSSLDNDNSTAVIRLANGQTALWNMARPDAAPIPLCVSVDAPSAGGEPSPASAQKTCASNISFAGFKFDVTGANATHVMVSTLDSSNRQQYLWACSVVDKVCEPESMPMQDPGSSSQPSSAGSSIDPSATPLATPPSAQQYKGRFIRTADGKSLVIVPESSDSPSGSAVVLHSLTNAQDIALSPPEVGFEIGDWADAVIVNMSAAAGEPPAYSLVAATLSDPSSVRVDQVALAPTASNQTPTSCSFKRSRAGMQIVLSSDGKGMAAWDALGADLWKVSPTGTCSTAPVTTLNFPIRAVVAPALGGFQMLAQPTSNSSWVLQRYSFDNGVTLTASQSLGAVIPRSAVLSVNETTVVTVGGVHGHIAVREYGGRKVYDSVTTVGGRVGGFWLQGAETLVVHEFHNGRLVPAFLRQGSWVASADNGIDGQLSTLIGTAGVCFRPDVDRCVAKRLPGPGAEQVLISVIGSDSRVLDVYVVEARINGEQIDLALSQTQSQAARKALEAFSSVRMTDELAAPGMAGCDGVAFVGNSTSAERLGAQQVAVLLARDAGGTVQSTKTTLQYIGLAQIQAVSCINNEEWLGLLIDYGGLRLFSNLSKDPLESWGPTVAGATVLQLIALDHAVGANTSADVWFAELDGNGSNLSFQLRRITSEDAQLSRPSAAQPASATPEANPRRKLVNAISSTTASSADGVWSSKSRLQSITPLRFAAALGRNNGALQMIVPDGPCMTIGSTTALVASTATVRLPQGLVAVGPEDPSERLWLQTGASRTELWLRDAGEGSADAAMPVCGIAH